MIFGIEKFIFRFKKKSRKGYLTFDNCDSHKRYLQLVLKGLAMIFAGQENPFIIF